MIRTSGLETSQSYIASEDLMKTVNIAMTLEKPLLVKGEPGTGKTMLAQAIADALGKKLLIWNIKSTTKAQDGLYTYDVVQRLYDSQFGANVDDVSKYIKFGKIGEAFLSEEQVVLLIDDSYQNAEGGIYRRTKVSVFYGGVLGVFACVGNADEKLFQHKVLKEAL